LFCRRYFAAIVWGKASADDYHNSLFVKERAWQGDHIANSFKKQIQKHAPFKSLGVLQWRHVVVAFTEKLLMYSSSFFQAPSYST
jgi:hypothetical protein